MQVLMEAPSSKSESDVFVPFDGRASLRSVVPLKRDWI